MNGPIGCEPLACSAPLYTPLYASKVVELLSADQEDQWKYVVETLPTGLARIMVFDNAGQQVGYL